MSYDDFLSAFAMEHGIANVGALLSDFADRYSFQIKSRERAKRAIEVLRHSVPLEFAGAKVLDVGCAYGSFAIEFAKLGASVTGIDISEKWLRLAEVNARGDAQPTFINCDASSRTAVKLLIEHGPFDLVVVNDVFEHIYDTAGLLNNLCSLMKPGSCLYFKVPNGLATRSVLSEGHKKKFGISLLAPDYWHMFVEAPFHIYYRRREYFDALFDKFGFRLRTDLNDMRDADAKATRTAIIFDLRDIRAQLKRENFSDQRAFMFLRQACQYYFDEVKGDLESLDWEPLYRKYRVTFWEGVLELKGKH